MSLSNLLIKAHEVLSTKTKNLLFRLGEQDAQIVLFFSLSNGKTRAKVGQVKGKSFIDVWKRGAILAQQLADKNKMIVRWLRIDWITSAESMSWEKFNSQYLTKNKRGYFRYGISFDDAFKCAFLEQELNANAMFYMGSKTSTAWFNEKNFMRYARSRYGSKISIDFSSSVPVIMFATQGVFVANDPALCNIPGNEYPQWLAEPDLNSGRRQIKYLSVDNVYSLILSGSKFLARQVNKEGKFIYGYFPCFAMKIPTYNSLRHASTTYSMIEAWELTQDNTLSLSIKRALHYLAESIIRRYPQEDGSVLAYNVDLNGEIKLGANAVSLLAMVKYTEVTNDEQYLPLMESLALGIARMQDPETGRFFHVLNASDLDIKEKFRIIYYDGEAAFGLMRLYGITKDPRWLAIVEKGFKYFLAAEHWKAHDHWLSYCVNELTLYKPDEKYFRFGVQNIAGHLDFIIHRITTYPTLLELSMAFHSMLIRIQKMPEMQHILAGFSVDKFYQALHYRAHYLLNGFFWPEFAMYYAKPSQIVGSFFIRHHAFRVRIDDVEHYLSGFIAYWKMLKEQEKDIGYAAPQPSILPLR
ncbi:hypothetical protein Nstercoris_01988 [Nitrosomonas stercoris]|uniref:Mur ligase n=1 Tax=Nitrosomonas stercoris TaxID=1444684 RepID=A0A4Y1YRQ7_9PROT|nr:hypothetical protein Nstercoris_01988 [Nitrosomonas stercoris]